MKPGVNREEKSWTFWAITGFLAIFLVVFPFYRGLFNGYEPSFEGNIYSAVNWTVVALFVVAMHVFRRGQLSTHRDVLSVFVWLIPLSYLISSFGAASSHMALNEVYIKVLWAVFFMIGAYFASHSLGSKIIQYALIGSGYILVIYGFLNWFGNADFHNAVLDSVRLSNVFQYPNAYAAYLIAILMSTLILIQVSKKWYYQLIPSIMLVPVLLSLLLTLSRGAILILPIVLVIYLILVPWYKQLIGLLYLGLAGIASFMLFSRMTAIRAELDKGYSFSISIKGWLLLIAISVAIAGLVFLVNRYVGQFLSNKFHQNNLMRWTNFILPVFFVVAAVGAYLLLTKVPAVIERLPADIKVRIEGLNSQTTSVFLRTAFYRDAMNIIHDYPVFGAGGGAWSALYNSYKSHPYISNQVHNFFVQYLVEAGWFGLAILLILVVYALVIFVIHYISNRHSEPDESRLIFPLFSIVLLGHSILDFDMSFVYLSAIVFLLLGASVSTSITPLPWLNKTNEKSAYRYLGKGFSGVLLVIVLIVLFHTIPAQAAVAQYNAALQIITSTRNYGEFKKPMDKAIELQPYHPDFNILKISVLFQLYEQTHDENFAVEAKSLIKNIEKREPYNRMLVDLKFSLFIQKGETEQAQRLIKSNLLRFPWDIGLIEKASALYVDLGTQADKNQKTELRDQYWNDALALLDRFNGDTAGATTDDEFKLNTKIAVQIAKVYYKRAQYNEAIAMLKPFIITDLSLPENRTVVRWYLAALTKQGKDDLDWRGRLYSVDQNEQQKIEFIVNTGEDIMEQKG